MAKVFLDANVFIDLVESRDTSFAKILEGNDLFVSPLSLEIWMYIYKRSIPYNKSEELFNTYNFIDYTLGIAQKSFTGPTPDFEDNVQLHSASDAECSVFLTKDTELLKLGYFGKVRISDNL